MSRGTVIGGMLALALAAAARAVEPSVEFDVQPRAIHVGETAVATLTLRGLPDADPPMFPAIQGFRVEPAGNETRVSIVNGQVDRSLVYRFALVAERPGDFPVGPFRYDVDKKTIDLPAIRIKVVAGAATGDSGKGKPAFARIVTERNEVYLHENFTVTVSIYSKGLNLASDIQLNGMPDSGLKLTPFVELPGGRDVVDGEVYEVRQFESTARALSAGTIALHPTLRVQVLSRRARPERGAGVFDNSFFEDFFQGTPFDRVERRPLDLPTDAVNLKVKPLPAEGRPSSFSGAVGKCEWDVSARPSELTVGEPVTLKIVIRGDANLDTVSAPALDLGPEFRVYEPKLAGGADANRRTFEQVVIPRDEKIRAIPEVRFTYFDTETGAYKTLKAGPFPLVLHPATNEARVLRAPIGAAPSAADLVKGSDIVYLKPAPAYWTRAGDRPWWTAWPGLTVHLAPPVLLALLALAARRRDLLEHDVARARREEAPRAARAAVRRATAAAAAADDAAFHEAVSDALSAYFGHRLNLHPGDVSAERALAAVERAGIEPSDREELARLFSECEAARFGGAAAGATAVRTQGGTLELLTRLLRRCERLKL